MERFKTKINVNSEKFKANHEKLLAVVKDLEEKLRESHFQGTEAELKRFSKEERILGEKITV